MLMALRDKKYKFGERPQVYKNKSFFASLEFAMMGIKTAYKDERNMRTHTTLALIAIVAGFLFHLARAEWLWIGLAIFLMHFAEMLNTSIENVVDLAANRHFHPLAKKAKDMAAGAVLFAAFFSLFVGCVIFLPKIWELLKSLN